MMLIRAARRARSEARVNLAHVRRWFVDVSLTAANVTWSSGVAPFTGNAGETITEGMPVYLNTADNEYYKCDADVEATSIIAGVALSNGVNGRPMLIAPPGAVINVGATLTAGTYYCASVTPGGVAPEVDLAAGDWPTILYVGNGTAVHEVIGKKGTAVHA